MIRNSFPSRLLQLAALAAAVHAAPALAWGEPTIDRSSTTAALEALPRTAGEKKVVTIYEFRSSVSEIPARGATDMFTTALVKSGAFAVGERHRLNEGVVREKQLNAAGQSTGTIAQSPLAGAAFIFEGTISEGGQGETQSTHTLNVGGMELGGGGGTDRIGVDVRVVDATTGLVLDSVNIAKSIESSQSSVSGVGNLLGAVLAARGRSMPVSVDAGLQTSRRESVDRALRACIEVAVLELVKRYGAH
jgi:Uncharacterized protein involved in formation of curli polymers